MKLFNNNSTVKQVTCLAWAVLLLTHSGHAQCVSFLMDAHTGSGDKGKCGFTESCYTGFPPHTYLSLTRLYYDYLDLVDSQVNISFGGEGTLTFVEIEDRWACTNSISCSGSATYWWNNNGYTGTESGSLQNAPSAAPSYWTDGGDAWYELDQDTGASAEATWCTVSLDCNQALDLVDITGSFSSENFSDDVEEEIQETLDSEYTTATLEGDVETLVGSDYAASGLVKGVGGANGSALLYLDESTAQKTKSIYHFRIPMSEMDVRYEFLWPVHTTTTVQVRNADNSITTTSWSETTSNSCMVDGNGGEVTTPDQTDLDVPFPSAGVSVQKSVSASEVVLLVISTDGSGGGCGSCSRGGGPPGSGPPNLDDPDLTLSLGNNLLGLHVGEIKINPTRPTVVTPALVNVFAMPADVSIRKANGYIRQIMASQVLVDVISNTACQFDLNFYDTNNFATTVVGGVYPVTSGAQFLTWRIENPGEVTDTNNIRMTEIRGTHLITNLFSWSGGLISFSAGNGLKLETVQKVYSSDGLIRTEISKICDQNSDVVYSRTNMFQVGTSGDSLMSTVEGTGNFARKTTYSHTSDGHLEEVDRPDGTWESYEYDGSGRLIQKNSENHYTIFDYAPLGESDDGSFASDAVRTTTEYFNDTVVAKRFRILSPAQRIELQATKASALWNDPANLGTTNNYDSNGRLISTFFPNCSVNWYSYNIGAAGKTNVVYVVGWNGSAYFTNQINTKIYGANGILLSDVTTENGLLTKSIIYTNYDALGRVGQILYLDNTSALYQYDCCGISSSVDRYGLTTVNGYNDLKQLVSKTEMGNQTITWYYLYDPMGHLLSTTRQGALPIVLGSATYDDAGHQLTSVNALGGQTTYSESLDTDSGGLVRTIVYPDTGIRIEKYGVDGTLASVTGTAVHGVRYEYGAETDANGTDCTFTEAIKLNADNSDSSETTTTYTDMIGHTTETLYADNSLSQSFYNSQGQLWKQVDPDNVVSLFTYNSKGERDFSILARTTATHGINAYEDLVSGLTGIWGGGDRVTETTNDVVFDHGMVVRRSQVSVWLDGQSSGTLTSLSEISADGLNSWQVKYGGVNKGATNQILHYYVGNIHTVTNVAQDASYLASIYSYGQLTSTTQFDSDGNKMTGTTYNYDDHGRQYQVIDSRNGSTTRGFNSADLVITNTTPLPGNGQSAESTVNLYDNMLRLRVVIQPDLSSNSTVYLLTGEVGMEYGSRKYPVAYRYDYSGRMKYMTNWSNFNNLTGARVTTWNYDANRGWLTSKTYDSGTPGPSYGYTLAGRLATRSWARGIHTVYDYDLAGDLNSISYDDGVTPSVTYGYDRLGRQTTTSASGITDTLAYNLANEPLGESFSGGFLNGLAVTNIYDNVLRRTSLAVLNGSSALATTTYGYDAASRLSSVSNGNGDTASYNYLANSPLVSQIAYKQNSATRMTTIKQYDYLNRLTQISSAPGAAYTLPLTYNYSYNSANQRTKDTLVDGSYWVYGYDSLGQVTNGCKYFANGTPVPGQQFDYAFDTIGNRTQTMTGGDTNGANLRVANYAANNLNQITSRDYPGTNDIVGASILTNAVTVNGQVAYRNGEYFWGTVKTNNALRPAWAGVTVSSGGVGNAGNVYFPQTPEQLRYDPDGNLTNDGRWAYTWDAENRLVGMTNNSGVGPLYGLEFAYDPKGRRIQKIVATNSGTAYIGQSTTTFLYDGWNLVAELAPNNSLIRSYTWGSDLSGSMQGAGGVGGLLEVSYYGISTTNCFPAFDGNGNLSALIHSADGTLTANYEYGPFGEVIRATGPMFKANPIRFSTKYDDDESDLFYYGYRYYKPSMGTWLSRDPLTEQSFLSSYSMGKKPIEQKLIQTRSLNQPYFYCINSPLTHTDGDGAYLLPPGFFFSLIIPTAKCGVRGCTFFHPSIRDYPEKPFLFSLCLIQYVPAFVSDVFAGNDAAAKIDCDRIHLCYLVYWGL